MAKKFALYKCKPCGYIYDPEKGEPTKKVEPGTPFEDLTEDNWSCPRCGANIWLFEKVEE